MRRHCFNTCADGKIYTGNGKTRFTLTGSSKFGSSVYLGDPNLSGLAAKVGCDQEFTLEGELPAYRRQVVGVIVNGYKSAGILAYINLYQQHWRTKRQA